MQENITQAGMQEGINAAVDGLVHTLKVYSTTYGPFYFSRTGNIVTCELPPHSNLTVPAGTLVRLINTPTDYKNSYTNHRFPIFKDDDFTPYPNVCLIISVGGVDVKNFGSSDVTIDLPYAFTVCYGLHGA